MEISLSAHDNAMKQIRENSRIFNQATFESLPRIHREDLVLGNLLGSGEFSDVYTVSINVTKKSSSNQSAVTTKQSLIEKSESSAYVIKQLRRNVVADKSKFHHGAVDLAIEAHLLASVTHPNIVNIHGISSDGVYGFESMNNYDFFLIMDKLDDTLDRRLDAWAANHQPITKSFMNVGKNKQKSISVNCLGVAYGFSSALKCLHEKNIVYRDLKPDNIGFDIYGNVKLFDLGTARELRPELKVTNDTYKMSFAGTYRYMAPEVAKGMPYNLSVDVYSFGILLWEMCALRKPFDGYDHKRFYKLVVHGNKRPKIQKSWPSSIRTLMNKCWSKDMNERPNFDDVLKTLENEMIYARSIKKSSHVISKAILPKTQKRQFFSKIA